jgi:hypothetical protein
VSNEKLSLPTSPALSAAHPKEKGLVDIKTLMLAAYWPTVRLALINKELFHKTKWQSPHLSSTALHA